MVRKIILSVILVTMLIPLVKAEQFKHHDVTFYISDEMKVKHKELIDLILLTESMDDDERQYWFDIMPSMTDAQVTRLYDIVETEKRKLEELEIKYQKEIKALNEKHLIEWNEFTQKKAVEKINKSIEKNKIKTNNLYYMSYNKHEIPRIKIIPMKDSKVESPYIPNDSDDLSKYEHMVLVEFGKKLVKNIAEYKKIYDKGIFKGYVDTIINSAIILNDTSTLALIYKNNLAEKTTVVNNMYLARNDFKSLALQYEKDLETDNWKKLTFSKLLNLTKWRNKRNCKNTCELVLKKYLSKITEDDYPLKLNNVRNSLDLELVLLDIIGYLNKDIVNDTLKERINSFTSLYSNKKEAFSENNRKWYMEVTKAYFNSSIRELYESTLSKYLNAEDFNAIEGDLLEVSTYFAFSLIKNNKEDEALKVLIASKRLGESVYSSAYDYIEKDLSNFLVEVASEPRKFKKGHVTLGTYQIKGDRKEFKPFGKKYAIIIGISDYQNLSNASDQVVNKDLYDLKYADKDALAFKKFLNTPENSGGAWEIYSFIEKNATTLSVRKKIDNILSNAKDNDLIYIFFSGHARLNPNNNEEVYLLTHEFNPEDPYSGIPYAWLISTINRSKAKHLITFIDACRSGTIKNSKGASLVDQDLLNNVLSHSATKVVFTSGSGSQISYEDDEFKKGIFTHFLLSGLYGEAKDVNQDGFVNLNELEDYTSTHVSKYTLDSEDVTYQRPRVSNLDPTFSVQFPLSIR